MYKNLSDIDWIMVTLGVAMLVCLLPLPYGMFNLLRFAIMVGFCVLCYDFRRRSSKALMIVFGCLALLFQPFFKIAIGRYLWQIIDVAVAVFLIVLLYKRLKFGK